MSTNSNTIAVIGGTGALGGGLAYRWARAGLPVVIGSRDADRAATAAAKLNERTGANNASGLENAAAAAAGTIVVLAVKFAHQRATLEQIRSAIAGKILVETTVPLMPPKVGRVQLPAEGSAALIAKEMLDESTIVVSAFQNIAAEALLGDADVDCDVLVTGDDVEARAAVIELAEAAGLKAWHAGPLDNAAATEALTSLLIQINKRYGIDHAGIRVTGTPGGDS